MNFLQIPIPICVRVDESPAFQCPILNQLGITIDIDRASKPNENTVVDKAIDGFEKENKITFIFRETN